MTKKRLFIFFIFASITSVVFSTQMAPLPEILRPAKIEVGDEYIYIIEDTTIYIYSLSDFKLKKKFGKQGEGPGEFPMGRHFNINMVNIFPQKDKVIINSSNKIMFFSKKGDFLSEKKITGFGSRITPFDDKYVGTSFSGFRGKNPSLTVNIYDSDLNKIKEVHRSPVNFGGMMGNSNAKINEFASVFGYATGNNKIYLFDTQDFIIRILDSEGNQKTPIKIKYEPVQITTKLRAKIMDFYKNVRYKRSWDRFRTRLELPDKFPAIQTIQVKDGKIYAQTYKSEKGKCEFYIFDKTNKLEKIVMLPLKQANVREYYPFCIKSSKIFQIAEDENEEAWVLHINNI